MSSMNDCGKDKKELLIEELSRQKKAEIAERSGEGSMRSEDGSMQREELLRKALEVLPVGVWITDKDGHILQGNPAGQKVWAGARYVGIDRYGEYKGWWADTGEPIGPEDWAAARAVLRGETSINEKVEIECFDRTRKFILNSAIPIRNATNEIIGTIIVNQDITELKKREDELKRLNDELQEALKKLKLLSGMIPICAGCKKIREDSGYWKQLEKYISEHSEAEFTHSLCPECAKRLYPDFYREDDKGEQKA